MINLWELIKQEEDVEKLLWKLVALYLFCAPAEQHFLVLNLILQPCGCAVLSTTLRAKHGAKRGYNRKRDCNTDFHVLSLAKQGFAEGGPTNEKRSRCSLVVYRSLIRFGTRERLKVSSLAMSA